MAPHVVALIFFAWGALCYVVGLAAPWTYLSFKNAYGEGLGITDEGRDVVPQYVQDKTCSRSKASLYVWKGVCDSGSCTAFDDHNAWEAVDLLNTEYSQYYKHAIETDFSGDDTNWTTVKGLVLTSVALTFASILTYLYGSSCNEAFLDDYVKYISFALVFTAATSMAAVVVSLNTYALGHQFYTGGANFVKGWFVYSAFVYGCEGPQYLPGPGIVMQVIGALTMLVLAMMLSCGCLTPRRMEGAEQMGQYDQYGVYGPVALATPILDEEVVYDDA